MYYFILLVLCLGSAFCNVPFFLTMKQPHLSKDLKKFFQTSRSPCENFYEYSCSSWKTETTKPDFETSWNHFTAASYELKKKIHKILTTKSNWEDEPLKKAKRFFNACVEYEKKQEHYFVNLKLLIEYFKGWPMVQKHWSVEKYDWFKEVTDITRILGFHPIIKLHVGIDYKKTGNYCLYVEPGNLIFPQSILLNPTRYSAELEAYTEWISKTIQHLYPTTEFSKKVKFDILKVVEFETHLAKLMTLNPKMERNTVKSFSKRFKINFVGIFKGLFSNLNISIQQSDIIIIRNYGYFKNLVMFLKKVNAKTIADYLVWTIAKEFSRETTNYLKTINFLIDRSVAGLTLDISREVECTNKAMDHFSYAFLPTYLNVYVGENVLKNVNEIVANIQLEYVDLLRDNIWLRNETKNLALQKIENIDCVVGYSEWMKNTSLLEKYYSQLNITDDHFLNVIRGKSFKIEKNLKLFATSVNAELWPSNIFDVNAYYSVLQNLVFIPLGILQEPFYDESRPSILNYGALGSLIGHELSHSLDTTGRQANAQGIITKWWPIQDIIRYKSKLKCFEKLYEDDRTNSLLTGENIADNVGLDISFKAYKKLKNVEPNGYFWGVENEYVFFLSYAQMWCEISDNLDLFSDEHISVEARVNQAVSNNINFNTLLECNKGASKNKICKLW